MKRSRQRDAIRNNLVERHDHPTAEMVFLDIREEIPNVSLGTVYRNLSLLAEMGEIQKLSPGIGPDRFDGNPKDHCHFLCKQCGGVWDLEIKLQDDLNAMAARGFSGRIETHTIQFSGRCSKCLMENNNSI